MFTEELRLKIAEANKRAQKLSRNIRTINLQTGRSTPKRNGVTSKPRYMVEGEIFTSTADIRDRYEFRDVSSVYFRLGSPSPKWVNWVHLNKGTGGPPVQK